jgi:predicted ATP-binding protein involved in virulence
MNSGPSFGIVSFNIEGFRGIKHASVEGIPADTKWIFLTGKNGGGKTSVLQALFVGIFGKSEGNTILEVEESKSKIRIQYLDGKVIKFNNGNIEPKEDRFLFIKGGYTSFDASKNVGYNLVLRPIAAYGANRTQIQFYSNSGILEQKYYQSKSLFGTDNLLLNIEVEFKNWVYRSTSQEVVSKDKDLAERLKLRAICLKKLLLRLMNNLADIEIDVVNDRLIYFEKDDFDEIISIPKSFGQLASGNRSIIAMIGDMVIRLLEGQPEISDPSDLEGIVLIDELDVHLHPSWQKALPGLLSDIFPKIQFIASTHSPIPLLGAPKETVVLKVHQSSQEGITVEKLDIDVTQLLPNSLLTSPIFDFEDIIPTANNSLEDLHTEDNFQEAMANEEIKNRLKKIAQTL